MHSHPLVIVENRLHSLAKSNTHKCISLSYNAMMHMLSILSCRLSNTSRVLIIPKII